MRVAARLETGICAISSGPTVNDEAQMPFGGVKASGYGRFGGKAGIAEFTELRWITVENSSQPYPFLSDADAGRDRRRRSRRAAARPAAGAGRPSMLVILERRSAEHVLSRIRAGVCSSRAASRCSNGRRGR